MDTRRPVRSVLTIDEARFGAAMPRSCALLCSVAGSAPWWFRESTVVVPGERQVDPANAREAGVECQAPRHAAGLPIAKQAVYIIMQEA